MKSTNRIVIVTGGSGLIGKAILSYLSKENSFAVYNFDLTSSGISGITDVNCDITDSKSIGDSLRSIAGQQGRLYGLVNNAYPRTSDWGKAFEVEQYASFQKNIEMQLSATLFICQQAGEHMTEGGSIVNISSIYGVVGNDPTLYEGTKVDPPGAYSAIKGGVINFTRFLAARWGHRNIRVNCVSPGGIFDRQDPEFVKRYESRVPLKRMGLPDDIAPPIGFLLSDQAKYVTGHNLVVDGGWTCI